MKKNMPVTPQTAALETLNDESSIAPEVQRILSQSGAIKYAKYKLEESKLEIGLMLAEVKRIEDFKAIGFDNFSDYCEKSLDIAPSTAYEILKQVDTLGDTVYKNLKMLGFSFRDMKALRAGKDEAQAEVTDTTITIGDETLDLVPENIKQIKKAIKDMNKALKDARIHTQKEITQRFELEKKVKELEQPKVIEIANDNEYKLRGAAIVQKFDAIISELFDHQKPALIDPIKWSYYYRTLAAINAAWEEQWEYLSNKSLMTEEG